MTRPAASLNELPDRDAQIVALVARFGQLSSAHIFSLLFNDLGSRTPLDRALKRLVARDYLVRVERRLVGGNRGGSGQFVYSLGRRGFFLRAVGRYSPARAVRYHSLAIADCFVTTRRLERQGLLQVAGFSTEPDCWTLIGRTELKPDMFLDLVRDGASLKLWLEVDMGTESQRQIKEKFERYWRAYNEADVSEWPEFPRVLFVAIDAERAKELLWLLGQGPKEALPLFAVTTLEGLQAHLTG